MKKLNLASIKKYFAGLKKAPFGYFTSEITPFKPELEKQKGMGFNYEGNEFIHHSPLHPNNTAFHTITATQAVVIGIIIIDFIVGLFTNWHLTLIAVMALLTILYFVDLLFNFYLILRSFSHPAEIKISDAEIKAIDEAKWQPYTILCPLYKEWQVLPQFITSISRLDYPKDRLQVILLLEEDDLETIAKIKQLDMPDYFQIVIVPDSKPKTKPKACNYGMRFATGEYIVVFDAEDIPDPLQLKKAILAFAKSGDKTICVQAKLNFYNPDQNILTRAFTSEYSLLFDLILAGLQSIEAPIPLGGTSNHFRVKDLIKLQGWDSFNVTEDADLGIRLVKQGFNTVIVDSTTLEEANSSFRSWFGQRARWIKGYMQTYLVHSRSFKEFASDKPKFHLFTFQMIIGGKILSMFINPVMWIITICYFLFRAHIGTFIESFFPGPVLYMGLFSFVTGNFLYMYYYMIGSKKHGHHHLVKYAVLIPIYWLAMSAAAWIAVYKLITAPHHWSKTSHGLYLKDFKTVAYANKMIGNNLVRDDLVRLPI